MSFDFMEPRIYLARVQKPDTHTVEDRKTHRKKGGALNRTDIVEHTRNHGGWADLPRKTVREALDFVIEEIPQTVLSGEVVKLTGFGTFELRKRADHLGRNPKTGEPLLIKSHHTVVFCPTRPFWREGKDKKDPT